MLLRLLVVCLLASTLVTVEARRSTRRGKAARRELSEDIQISTSKENQRQGKFFNLFNVVTFENAPCRSTSSISGSVNRNGTCLTNTECNDRGGTINGNCAAGFGACCVFIKDQTGTSTITQNCTYIQNPGYPSAYTDTTALSYTVQKCDDNVCMVRLDFETFTIQGPSVTTEATGGVCTDTFIATVQSGVTIPTVCGTLTGQHMYMDLGQTASSTAMLNFAFSGTSNRQFEIKVTQLECNNPNRPYDTGCGQYHVGTTGRITNYNFQPADTTTHLASQFYSVCIRQEAGMGCIEYTACTDTTPTNAAFSVTSHAATAANTADLATGIVDDCTEDYVFIMDAAHTCSCSGSVPLRNKFCGIFFSAVMSSTAHAPVCSCAPPFGIGVNFDNGADGTSTTNASPIVSKGFCLDYRQISC